MNEIILNNSKYSTTKSSYNILNNNSINNFDNNINLSQAPPIFDFLHNMEGPLNIKSHTDLNKSNTNNINPSQNNAQIKNLAPHIPILESKLGNASIIVQEIKENQKVDDSMDNFFEDDKIMFPEAEKKNFEKRQLSYQTCGEVIDELRSMLFTQKEKYHKFTKYARIFESKFMDILNNILNNSHACLDTQIKSQNLNNKIKLTEAKVSKIKFEIIKADKIMSERLGLIKNNFSFLKKKSFEDGCGFYEDLIDAYDKVRQINNNIKSSWDSMTKNENDELSEILNKGNNSNGFNKEDEIVIERKNVDNVNVKISISQKDLNHIFTDCYEGLYGLKTLQDEVNFKLDSIEKKLKREIEKHQKKP